MENALNANEIKVLRIIGGCGRRTVLTSFGNILVSNQASKLVSAGLIRQNPSKWIAYELTIAGKSILNN